jgi:hypothetical protein
MVKKSKYDSDDEIRSFYLKEVNTTTTGHISGYLASVES